MNAKEHNKLVGIFLMIHGGLQALIMLLMGLIYGGIGTAIAVGGKNDEKFVGVIFIAVVFFILAAALIFILPQMIGGWKIFKEAPNARNWGIAGSILAALSFPLGTAVGVYGMWFLFGDLGKQFYLNTQNANFLGGFSQSNTTNVPHEPHSWK